jgi:hypothetical protein
MDIIGLLVEHATFGVGYIAGITDGIMMIQFSKEQKRFLYPSAFENHLVIVDEKAREDISRDISQMQREEAIRVDESKKIHALESEQKQALRLDDIHKPKREKIELQKASRLTPLPDGKQQTFFVFQGKTFAQESKGGYIWAPLTSASGRSFQHWDKLLEVKPGDIIFHGCNAKLVAVSIAKGECYEALGPWNLKRIGSGRETSRLRISHVGQPHPNESIPRRHHSTQ